MWVIFVPVYHFQQYLQRMRENKTCRHFHVWIYFNNGNLGCNWKPVLGQVYDCTTGSAYHLSASVIASDRNCMALNYLLHGKNNPQVTVRAYYSVWILHIYNLSDLIESLSNQRKMERLLLLNMTSSEGCRIWKFWWQSESNEDSRYLEQSNNCTGVR